MVRSFGNLKVGGLDAYTVNRLRKDIPSIEVPSQYVRRHATREMFKATWKEMCED
jgi:hypothetical protein